jgi:hypothetical protein
MKWLKRHWLWIAVALLAYVFIVGGTKIQNLFGAKSPRGGPIGGPGGITYDKPAAGG